MKLPIIPQLKLVHQLEVALSPIVHNEFHRGIFIWEPMGHFEVRGFFRVEPTVTGFLAELLGLGSFHL